MTLVNRLDADETLFFQRELEHVQVKSYDVKYPELKSRQLFPVNMSVSPHAQTYVYKQYDQVGIARFIQSYADDLPRADVTGKEFVSRIKALGASYGYSTEEIRIAKATGMPLEQRKANASRRATMTLEDQTAFFGDAENNLVGVLNNPNILQYVVPNGVSASPLWSSKTADEILKDLNGIVSQIRELTREVENPDTLLLPTAKYNFIAQTARSGVSDTTILEFFLKNNSVGITSVISVPRLTGAGTAGADVMLAYRRDPDALEMIVPMDYTAYAPEQRGLEFIVACEQKFGGVVVYYPFSISKAEGI
jgi:hypothetical protein